MQRPLFFSARNDAAGAQTGAAASASSAAASAPATAPPAVAPRGLTPFDVIGRYEARLSPSTRSSSSGGSSIANATERLALAGRKRNASDDSSMQQPQPPQPPALARGSNLSRQRAQLPPVPLFRSPAASTSARVTHADAAAERADRALDAAEQRAARDAARFARDMPHPMRVDAETAQMSSSLHRFLSRSTDADDELFFESDPGSSHSSNGSSSSGRPLSSTSFSSSGSSSSSGRRSRARNASRSRSSTPSSPSTASTPRTPGGLSVASSRSGSAAPSTHTAESNYVMAVGDKARQNALLICLTSSSYLACTAALLLFCVGQICEFRSRQQVGLAAMDLNERELILCQYGDNQTYCSTAMWVAQFMPREVSRHSSSDRECCLGLNQQSSFQRLTRGVLCRSSSLVHCRS